MSFSTDSSRMYAALRCIETELAKSRPSVKRLREIVVEAGRELRPTTGAVDVAVLAASSDDIQKDITRANIVASQPHH